MKKLSTLAVALALAFAGTAALADDNSMSRFGGESYAAFHAAPAADGALAKVGPVYLPADNSMSRWNGESYVAFADAAKDEPKATLASLRRPASEPAARPRVTRLSRTPMPANPFSDTTG
jgi:hypothetical protein